MAKEYHDCEFWLPPEFLNEDDFMQDFKENEKETNKCFLSDSLQGFGYGAGAFEPKSGSSSNGGSMSLTESESDEDDYVIGLSSRMAQSTLEEDEGHVYGSKKVWGLSGSPKSPLCSGLFPNNKGLFAPLEQPCSNFGSHQLSYHQVQDARFEQLKRKQIMKEQSQSGCFRIQENGGYGDFYQMKPTQQLDHSRVQNGGRRQVGWSNSAWPTLQQSQQTGSRMRAVFLGNPGATKERTGTGVFLPRRIGSTESHKNKPACSTVLLPEKVVQALNLNLEKLDAKPQFHPRNIGSAVAYEAALKYGKKNQYNGKQRQNRENSTRMQAVADEVKLPPEWIY